MSLRRGGTPLLGPGIPSLESSNQAQIDDLVQRNRTLEHTNQKLAAQVTAEVNRSKEAVLVIQAQWDDNQRQWKEGCEDLLASYRLVQKRLEVELERERGAVIKEMAITREEKLQRLQRDFKIKLFQMKEEETDRRIEELEDEKVRMEEHYDLVLQKMKDKCADYAIKLQDTQNLLARSEKEKEEKELKHNKLLEKHANFEAIAATSTSKLERTQLQLDGVQIKLEEYERTVDDLKRTNADLTRQLDKWQSLETKEGAAAESQRKQRVALETELRDLKEEYENKAEKDKNDLDKEKRRVERMKDTVASWEVSSKQHEQDTKDAKKQIAKLQKQLEKLKDDLEFERARVRPPSPQKPRAPSPPVEDEVMEVEADEEEPPRRGKSASVKPDSKRPTVKAGLSRKISSKEPGTFEEQIARKKTGGRPPPARKVVSAPITDSEIEEISNPDARAEEPPEEEDTTRRKRKGKEKAKEVDDVEVEEAPPVGEKKGKRKADEQEKPKEDDEDAEIVEQPNPKKRGKRAGSELKETTTNRGKSKPASRAGSKQPIAKPSRQEADKDVEGGEEDDQAAPKKKKRKIGNIFPGGDKAAGLPQFSSFGNGLLDIPSVLSPVRQDELVPQRSTSSSLVGSLGLGSIMRNPFAGSRR